MNRRDRRRVRKQARTHSKPVIIPAHAELTAHADAIRRLGRQSFNDVCEIGRRLVECRKLLKAQRVWLAWLKLEFGWSRGHAERAIAAHSSRAKLLKLNTLGVGLSGLYLLAKASPKVVEAVERRAEAGERLRLHDIRQHIVAEQRPQQRIQITATERPQSERQQTLTTEDLHKALLQQKTRELPFRLRDFADFIADLPTDEIIAAMEPATRSAITADIRIIKTGLDALSAALWDINKPKLVKDAEDAADDDTTKH
jgi:hypothetical protein